MNIDPDLAHELAWTMDDCLMVHLQDVDMVSTISTTRLNAHLIVDRFRDEAREGGIILLETQDKEVLLRLLAYIIKENVYAHTLTEADLLNIYDSFST